MMLIEPERSQVALRLVVQQVAQLKPGEAVCIDVSLLRDIQAHEHNGYRFTPPDRVLGNIVGANYEFWYRRDDRNRDVTFYRIAKPRDGLRTHVDPDRQHYYTKDCDGFYHLKPDIDAT